MSVVYAYICTRTTADPFVPSRTVSIDRLSRDVSDALAAIAGGFFTVGKIALFPVQRSVPNHLLCDGREVPRASFPELYDLLQDTQGAPANALNFVLPNYLNAITPAVTAVPETATQGTVTTPAPTGATPTNTAANFGDADSGGRIIP